MKTFNEFLAEQQELDEDIVRSGTVSTFAARSRAAGVKAEKSYKRGLTELRKPIDHENLVDQLEQTYSALQAILEGQLHQLQQINNHVLLNAVGHLAKRKQR